MLPKAMKNDHVQIENKSLMYTHPVSFHVMQAVSGLAARTFVIFTYFL
jgi:hypothetical protein